MSHLYERAPEEVSDLAREIIDLHHADLGRVKTRLDILFIRSELDENNDPKDLDPLKLNGYPCAAIVKLTNAKDKVKGMGDAEIVIDARRFEEMTDRQQRALLDHEITHLQVKDTDGEGRPILKMRLHDRQLGMFDVIAERYGSDSIEVQNMNALVDEARLIYFQPELFDAVSKPAPPRAKKGGGTIVTFNKDFAEKVEKELSQLPGIESVKVSVQRSRA